MLTGFANAQLKGVLNRAKEKISSKTSEKVNKKVDDTVDGNSGDNTSTKENSETDATGNSPNPAPIKAYSKYDFVPGEKIIVFEDFMQDAVGDFPDKWNTNASGETVTIEGWPSRDGKPYLRLMRAMDAKGKPIGQSAFGQSDS